MTHDVVPCMMFLGHCLASPGRETQKIITFTHHMHARDWPTNDLGNLQSIFTFIHFCHSAYWCSQVNSIRCLQIYKSTRPIFSSALAACIVKQVLLIFYAFHLYLTSFKSLVLCYWRFNVNSTLFTCWFFLFEINHLNSLCWE